VSTINSRGEGDFLLNFLFKTSGTTVTTGVSLSLLLMVPALRLIAPAIRLLLPASVQLIVLGTHSPSEGTVLTSTCKGEGVFRLNLLLVRSGTVTSGELLLTISDSNRPDLVLLW